MYHRTAAVVCRVRLIILAAAATAPAVSVVGSIAAPVDNVSRYVYTRPQPRCYHYGVLSPATHSGSPRGPSVYCSRSRAAKVMVSLPSVSLTKLKPILERRKTAFLPSTYIKFVLPFGSMTYIATPSPTHRR